MKALPYSVVYALYFMAHPYSKLWFLGVQRIAKTTSIISVALVSNGSISTGGFVLEGDIVTIHAYMCVCKTI